jgi:hypothetical protein
MQESPDFDLMQIIDETKEFAARGKALLPMRPLDLNDTGLG